MWAASAVPGRVLRFVLIDTNGIVDILAKDYPTVEPVE